MVEDKQPNSEKQQQSKKDVDPKAFNTTPKINPDIDYINRTMP